MDPIARATWDLLPTLESPAANDVKRQAEEAFGRGESVSIVESDGTLTKVFRPNWLHKPPLPGGA